MSISEFSLEGKVTVVGASFVTGHALIVNGGNLAWYKVGQQ